MNVLDTISDNLRRSLERPLCAKCQLSNVEVKGTMCDWCMKSKDRKAASLAEFLNGRKENER